MHLPLPRACGAHRRLLGPRARPGVEPLEPRSLFSVTPSPALSLSGAADPSDTLDSAAALGDLSGTPSLQVDAAIGDSPAGAADVDWYAFTLDRPATVTLAATGAAGVQPPVLSLYVRDPFDPEDPATLLGVRRLAQAAGTDGTSLTRSLAAGSYYLAASGAGNSLFSPFLANSGYDGQAGDYHLQLTAADLGLAPDAGPTVLASDPADGSSLDRSPTVIRLDLSAAIDPTTVLLGGDDVWLTYNPTGAFGDGNDQDVPLGASHFSVAATELQLTPAAPLAPGYYRLQLAGDTGANLDVVTGPDGTPLGADALHPSGQDFALTFCVAGVEGNTAAGAGADDTPAGAHDLGDVSGGRLVQAAGAIGDDPTDPVPFNPSDVDLYHFRLSGPGRYAFAAEVFAQRIGSPLNAAASLFVLDPGDGRLHLVAGNDDTQNPTRASDHNNSPLLFADPAVFAGLTAGDYYLAVSSRKNVPDADRGLLPGAGGVFDPEVSHSGSAGRSRGDYELNLQVWPDDVPPQVVAVTPAAGDTLDAPPASLTVQFDSPVNVQELAFRAYQNAQQGGMTAVYVQGTDGIRYYPRLQGFDPATSQATFLMLDRLPVGGYDLHLSGPLGLADFAGNPLAGNDPSGDYVAHFTVAGTGVAPPAADGPQELGVLFPHELQGSGFVIAPSVNSAYRIRVLQAQNYFFLLGASQPSGARLTLTDDAGTGVVTKAQADGVSVLAFLQPGEYTVGVTGWDPAAGEYTVRVVLGGSPENPQPLTVGPAPVLRLKLAPPPVVTPPVTEPPVEVPPVVDQPGTSPPPSDGTVSPTPPVPVPPVTPPVTAPPADVPPVVAPPATPPAPSGGTAPSTPPAPPPAAPPAEAPPVVAPPATSPPPSGGSASPTVPAVPGSTGTAPRVQVPAGEVQSATGPTAGAPGAVVTPAVTTTGAAVEAPSGQLVALAAGPVGGVGASTGGERTRAPSLSLGLPDGTAQRDPVRPAADAGQPSGAAPASLAAGDGAAIRATVADVARRTGLQRWWNMFFDDAPAPDEGDDDCPGTPDKARPSEDEQAAPETTPADGPGARSAPTLVAGLAALAVIASGLRERRRNTAPGTGRGDAPAP